MSNEKELPIEWHLTGNDALVEGSYWTRYRAQKYLDGGSLVVRNTAGYTAYMNIRADYDEPVILTLTTENGRLEVGDPDWTIKLTLTDTATAGVTALQEMGVGVYDLFLVDTYGHKQMNYFGRVSMQRKVSP